MCLTPLSLQYNIQQTKFRVRYNLPRGLPQHLAGDRMECNHRICWMDLTPLKVMLLKCQHYLCDPCLRLLPRKECPYCRGPIRCAQPVNELVKREAHLLLTEAMELETKPPVIPQDDLPAHVENNNRDEADGKFRGITMQKRMEQVQELPSGKCIRKYSPEHPLFDAGTRLWATKYYQEAESMVQIEQVDGNAEQTATMTCRLSNCNVIFHSVAAYEEHYDLVHRNICRECSRSFLSLRLLDIHISETHDPFFKILSKKKPMYACLVDGCPETFKHDDKRLRHLVQVHQYPESFSFHQRRKQKGGENGSVCVNHNEKDEQLEVDAETAKKREARKRRRQQKKKKIAEQTKCQGSDMQVDTADLNGVINNEAVQSEITDVDMTELEESMQDLRIPKSVHFGRKRRI